MIKTLHLRLSLLLGAVCRPDPMGGQALIEGVMMRAKDRVSVALRRKDGRIEEKVDLHQAWRERYGILRLFVIRGAVTLIESLVLGFRYLSYSADMALLDEKGAAAKKGRFDALLNTGSLFVALAVGVGVFMYAPIRLAGFIADKNANPLVFNLVAGAIRISFFLLYVWGISFMKDIRRVFEYHGAEHKTLFAYEAEKELTVGNSRPFSTRHPRCGTSFLLIAGLACILVFAFIDALYLYAFKPVDYTALQRLAVHLLLVPLVSGVSFEALRFSARHQNHPLVRRLILPGLWLQSITTREPDDSELEVALVSLRNAL
ncbi:MAG: DUF1385 domain-containing protein [Fibrobacterota bacterium]